MKLSDIVEYLERCVTATELCRRLNLPRTTLQNWLREGKIEYLKISRSVYVPLDQFVRVEHSPRVDDLPGRLLHLPTGPARPAGAKGRPRGRRTTGATG
jgi:excisionase family DNA binding protein